MTMTDSKMPPVLLVWAVVASVVAGGLFVWPLHVVIVAGQDSGVVLVGFGLWLAAVALLHPGPEWFDGGWTTWNTALQVTACVGLMGMDGVILAELGGMLQTFYYFETPRWALILVIIGVVGWGARGRGATLWRTVFFWIPILLGITFLTLLIALTNFHYGRVVLPNHVIVISAQLRGFLVLAYVGVPFGATLRSVRHVLGAPSSWGWRLVAIIVPWTLLAALYIMTMGSIGDQALVHLRWPVVFTLDHVTLDSTFFLSRIGLVVVFGWTMGVALGLMVHLRLLIEVAHDTVPRITPYLPWGVGMFWAVSTMLFPSPDVATQFLLTIVNPCSGLYLLVEMGFLITWRGTQGRRRRRQTPSPRPKEA